ncbi:hypothetical protein G4V62_14385 [Bacillaceae bacterium SIJ1]|uniref:hypothetical protein n=1 Tax=Litoribacterium kuwaitense TaxID=1398745 RepID=UPI0013EA0C98|nr:hypothetical protein [Litoribacterium kuwaitense]NGP46080.1 hypothetical protein [Litoribacterium kuwaitense]
MRNAILVVIYTKKTMPLCWQTTAAHRSSFIDSYGRSPSLLLCQVLLARFI